ncbi:MAG: hypothetical protein ACJARP_003069 [Vicingaceae bacterium]|jgi:hypothetical protein
MYNIVNIDNLKKDNTINSSFSILKPKRTISGQFQDIAAKEVFRSLSHADFIPYSEINFHTTESGKKQRNWLADLEKNQSET